MVFLCDCQGFGHPMAAGKKLVGLVTSDWCDWIPKNGTWAKISTELCRTLESMVFEGFWPFHLVMANMELQDKCHAKI